MVINPAANIMLRPAPDPTDFSTSGMLKSSTSTSLRTKLRQRNAKNKRTSLSVLFWFMTGRKSRRPAMVIVNTWIFSRIPFYT